MELIPAILNKIDNNITKLGHSPYTTQNGKQITILKGEAINFQTLTPRIRVKLGNRKVERFAELE